jgi:eukaryotic-like serine/threonine-protein kinase
LQTKRYDKSMTSRGSQSMPSDQGSKTVSSSSAGSKSLPQSIVAPNAGDATPRPVTLSAASPASPDDRTVISKASVTADSAPPLVLTPQHLGQALIGKRLDHYELVEFVGGGGMGAVFRATDTRLGRTVAVKVLSRDHTDEETIRRFRNEAQSAARLDHPNIARVHFVGEDAGWNYIVFEFIEGVNLRDLVERGGPISVNDALDYTLQVAEALAHSSSRDVVHRDIKPSNVLVTPTGLVKLVDMGLARLHQVESSSDDLTASGVTLGTFDYISPEQARDPRSADVRSDIYSLGCTLYFMLVGRPPFPEGTALQKLLRHNGDDPPDARLFRPELSPKVSALLSRMLAKRPSHRPQTPEQLMHEIATLGDQLGLEFARRRAADWAAAAPPPTLWQRMAPVAIPLMILAIVIVALDAFVPAREPSDNVSLRPTFPPATTASTTNSKTPEGIAAELQKRPITDPDRSLRRDGPLLTRDSAKAGATPSATSIPKDDPPPSLAERGKTPSTNGSTLTSEAGPRVSETRSSTPPIATAPMSDAGTSGSTTSPSATIQAGADVKPVVHRLVVEPGVASAMTDGVETVTSLSKAVRRASELGLSEIELRFDGDLREKPLDVPVSRLAIRAGAGFKPRIVFQPEVSTLPELRQMIRLSGSSTSRLSMAGVHVRMELPSTPSFGWALVAVQSGQSVEISDAIMTVVDKGTSGAPVHDQVAVFQVLPRRIVDTMKMEDESAMAPPVTIGLTRTIVRGEATLVSMPDESPFKLAWNQGLLVTNRRLIETGGTVLKPKWFGRVEIDLDHVTAVAEQGIHQMRRRSGAAHQLDVDVRSNRSILYTAPESPIFEFADVPTVEDVKLTFDGADNCYPRPDVVFVRVKSSTPGEGEVDFDLENRSRWSMERRPDLGVAWKNPPAANAQPHDHTKLHYVQADGATNDAGFDPALLPNTLQPAEDVASPAAVGLPMDDDDDPAPAPPTDVTSPTGMQIPARAPESEPMSRAIRGTLK